MAMAGAAGLMPGLAGLLNPAGLAAATAATSGDNTMRDAFQEVLKLYGVPTELAEAIAKNAMAAQGKSISYVLHLICSGFQVRIACLRKTKFVLLFSNCVSNSSVQNDIRNNIGHFFLF